jgi:hypothetical protein
MNARVALVAAAALAALVAVSAMVTGCASGGSGAAVPSVSSESVTVVRSFEQGQTMKYRFKIESQSGVKRVGYEQSIATSHELRTTCTITTVAADKVEMGMRFDYAAGSMTFGDDMIADKDVVTLRGKQLDFTLTPDGKITGWGGLTGEAALEGGAGQFAMLLYDVFPTLPAGPMNVGMTWTEPYDIPDLSASADRDFVGESTYTVVGFKRKFEIPCVEIKRVTTFEFEGRAEQAGEVWLMSGQGTTTGTMLVSTADGRLVWSSSDSDMTLEGEGASVASAAASGTVEMGIKSKLVIEML